ncbi:hypothetical protein CDCA_CDCA03G0820 [Cyanidium caldarium]|uniref:Uncharacterized protein n=1 Tax=Cyanidium caldarium TaxID=2771 RepID=A0AAV9IRS2_CYACA|nr:hypothetical protein CDCA_CDCA03G0820 [Cyanidium caldarium]
MGTRPLSETPPGAHPHPCNDALEEVIDGLLQWPVRVRKPWAEFRACLRVHGFFIKRDEEEVDAEGGGHDDHRGRPER